MDDFSRRRGEDIKLIVVEESGRGDDILGLDDTTKQDEPDDELLEFDPTRKTSEKLDERPRTIRENSSSRNFNRIRATRIRFERCVRMVYPLIFDRKYGFIFNGSRDRGCDLEESVDTISACLSVAQKCGRKIEHWKCETNVNHVECV